MGQPHPKDVVVQNRPSKVSAKANSGARAQSQGAITKKPKYEASQVPNHSCDLPEGESDLDHKISCSRRNSSKKGSSNPFPVPSTTGVSVQGRDGKLWKRAERGPGPEGQQEVPIKKAQVSSKVPTEDRLVAVDIRYEPSFSRGTSVEAEAAEQPRRSL